MICTPSIQGYHPFLEFYSLDGNPNHFVRIQWKSANNSELMDTLYKIK